MKKINIDRDYLRLCVYMLIVIITALLFEKLISNIPGIGAAIKMAGSILSPFVYAFFISFFLNPFARWLQTSVFVSERLNQKTVRIISSTVALLFFISIIVIIIAFIMPEVVVSVYSLMRSLPYTIDAAQKQFASFLAHIADNYGYITPEQLIQAVEPFFAGFGSITEIMSSVLTGTLSFGKGIFNFLVGLIIAFYMLIYKDGFKAYWVKIIYALFKPERAERLVWNCGRINKVYEGFFVGKTLDSAIIGTICFIVMSVVIKPRYVLLSSVVIGVTNMIPFFGPFIGAIPIIILNLLYDVKMAVMVALFILLLQQFDGYILGPKILGDSTGLSPFWVIASILVGGALMGFFGMFLGVPTFAVIKMFADEAIEKRFVEKYGRPQAGCPTEKAAGSPD